MKLTSIFGRLDTAARGVALLTIFAVCPHTPTALADHKDGHKPDGGRGGGGPTSETTFYSVVMAGDLKIDGYFDDGNWDSDVSGVEGTSHEDFAILVVRPRPAVCISNAFLSSGNVILNGQPCGAGVIPSAPGKPNWGSLTVVKTADGTASVAYKIGETNVDGKTNRYSLQTEAGSIDESQSNGATWPNGTGDLDNPATYTVTVLAGTEWSLVQDKPGKTNETLISAAATTITFTERQLED